MNTMAISAKVELSGLNVTISATGSPVAPGLRKIHQASFDTRSDAIAYMLSGALSVIHNYEACVKLPGSSDAYTCKCASLLVIGI